MALRGRPSMVAWHFALVAVMVALLPVKAQPSIPGSMYSKVVDASFMFYEAQISGAKPAWSRVAWRGDSALRDGYGDNTASSITGRNPVNPYPGTSSPDSGVDLSGGWFENGGHVKNSLTMGATASLLAYGAVSYENALRKSGLWDRVVRNIIVPAEYLRKAYYYDVDEGAQKFVAQIGDAYTDDKAWEAPEVQLSGEGGAEGSDTWRPAYTIKADSKRGADVVGQAAAAVASAAALLRRLGPYSDVDAEGYMDASFIYGAAQQMYAFASQFEGVFIIPDGNVTVLSRTYRDDMAWAAAWLCRWQLEAKIDRVAEVDNGAINYCQAAADWWDKMQAVRGMQPWLTSDIMHVAVALHMRDLVEMGAGELASREEQFLAMTDNTWSWWENHFNVPCQPCEDVGLCKTPGGFMILNQYGSAHLTANMALVALASGPRPGEAVRNPGTNRPYFLSKVQRQCWAKSQIDYLLGSNINNRAYVTGLTADDGLPGGVAVPSKPRHRGANCGGGAGCPQPSEAPKQTLVGALVGGPKWDDSFSDSLNSYQSLVSIEYNAGLTGAAMALAALESVKPAGQSWASYCAATADITAYEATSGYVTELTSPAPGTACPDACPADFDTAKTCGLFLGTFTDLGTGATKTLSCNSIFSKTLNRKVTLDADGQLSFYTYDKTTGVATPTGGFYPSKTYLEAAGGVGPYKNLALKLGDDGQFNIIATNPDGVLVSALLYSAQGNDATGYGSDRGPFRTIVQDLYEHMDTFNGVEQLVFKTH